MELGEEALEEDGRQVRMFVVGRGRWRIEWIRLTALPLVSDIESIWQCVVCPETGAD